MASGGLSTKPAPMRAKPQPRGGHSHSQLGGRSMATLAADAAAMWLMVGAVQLSAALCVDYSLYDGHQWPALLQQVVTMTWVPQAEMLMELYLEHYPERYDEAVAWRENSGFTMDSAVKSTGAPDDSMARVLVPQMTQAWLEYWCPR
ncbi:hypothetical protein ACOMHN_015432 [Nucella lapillus]